MDSEVLRRVECAIGKVDWNLVAERMLEDVRAGGVQPRERAKRDERRVRRLIVSGRKPTGL